MSDASGERVPDRLRSTRFAIVPEWLLCEAGDVVKLYGWLDRYANRDGELWPGQEELAGRMGCSDRHVRSLMTRLKEIGALEVLKRRWNGSTVYLLVRDRPEQECLTDRNEGSEWSGTPVPPNESHRTRATEREPHLRDQTQLLSEPAPLSEPSPDLGAQFLTQSFDLFYKAYPRKTAKGAARKVWATAVKKAGGAQKIIDGAARYAADPNRDPSYTKYPASWLSAECWDDEPLPARSKAGTKSPTAHLSTADRAMAEDPNYWKEQG